jgi:hypothetical protein
VIKDYVKLDSDCMQAILILKDKETCFEWEEPLWELIDK